MNGSFGNGAKLILQPFFPPFFSISFFNLWLYSAIERSASTLQCIYLPADPEITTTIHWWLCIPGATTFKKPQWRITDELNENEEQKDDEKRTLRLFNHKSIIHSNCVVKQWTILLIIVNVSSNLHFHRTRQIEKCLFQM